MSNGICAVILAAGKGQRYRDAAGQGQDKLLALCTGLDGVPRAVLEHSLIHLSGIAQRRVLVTQPGRAEVIELARRYDCEVVLLESAGMGDSLAAGVKAAAGAEGWLVVLADMPFIQPGSLAAVAASVRPHTISVADAGQGPGHPVGFAREFGDALMALRGDQGARRLFATAQVHSVTVGDAGIYRDVDTPADLA
jgi:molybdenum cofactor cytidylyltransferase